MRKYWITTYAITIIFLGLGCSVFFLSYARLTETIYDLVMSVCYYFCGLLKIPCKLPITVKDYSVIFKFTSQSVNMSETVDGFKTDFWFFIKYIFLGYNFKGYLVVDLDFVTKLLSIVALLVPILYT